MSIVHDAASSGGGMGVPESIYRAVFEQAKQAMIVLNRQGIPALWNSSFEDLFTELAGFVPEKLAVPLFDWLEERESFGYSYYVNEVLLGRMGVATIESGIRSASGSRLWIRTTLSPIDSLVAVDHTNMTRGRQMPDSYLKHGHEQNERWLWCSFLDVTEQKLKERDLLSAKEEAERATETKSQFLATMSHEIRTPIQTILGMTELLAETRLDKEQLDYTRTVRFSADVLLGLINDVLDFSKIEAGKLELDTMDYDLRFVLRQAVNLIILDAHKKSLEVILDVDHELPRIVHGDPGRMRQIIVNLFKNAVKFTHAGEIVIEARCVNSDGYDPGADSGQSGSSARSIHLAIADSGTGIPDSIRNTLFTPFTQAISGAKTQGGTGLGLAISKYLVGAMGGTIRFEPNEPRGSVFTVELPLHAPRAWPPRPQLPEPARLPSARVLVVDDNSRALAHTKRVVAGFGLDVDGASSGSDALLTMRTAAKHGSPYAACLVDQSMPGMDGWRLAAEVTADRLINETRLVLLVPEGDIGRDTKMKLLTWFNGYAAKPIHPDELYEILQRTLGDDVDLQAIDEYEQIEQKNVSMIPGLGLSVLLAEDHQVNQALFTVLLERLGCEVTVADDGVDALSKAKAGYFDMVLMDIFMPRMDGYEAARTLRERGFSKPIIAITASALKGERDKCIAVGMNDVLVKPFKKAELATMLGFWTQKLSEASAPVLASGPPSACDDTGRDVFDYEGLVETFLGKKDKVISLLARFSTKTRSQLADMQAAAQARDDKSMREIAHSIKGAAWSLSAKTLGDAAMLIETQASNGNAEAAAALIPGLVKRFAEFESRSKYCVEEA